MEQSSPTHGESHYEAEELGLVLSDPLDMQLYIESNGLREVGALLIEKRKLKALHLSGELSDETAELYADRLDDEIAEARRKYNPETT